MLTLLATLTPLPPLPLWAWLTFFAFIAAMLALDLGVFHRGSKTVSTREALIWCGVWASLAFGSCHGAARNTPSNSSRAT
jgi:tellurite resistance protein TerC